jgi:hypothetical protein
MIALLVVAIAAVAVLAYAGNRMARSRARQRREHERRERLAHDARMAAAQAAAARVQDDRRRPDRLDEDDALTSVMPAIKLPWPTTPPLIERHGPSYPAFGSSTRFQDFDRDAAYPAFDGGDGQAGYSGDRDFDAGYPEFSAGTPFQADDEPAGHTGSGYPSDDHDRYDDHYLDDTSLYRTGPAGQDTRPGGEWDEQPGPPLYPGRSGSGGWPNDHIVPSPRPGEHLAPAARPGEHNAPGDRARKRVGQGNHRGGHAKRRRG